MSVTILPIGALFPVCTILIWKVMEENDISVGFSSLWRQSSHLDWYIQVTWCVYLIVSAIYKWLLLLLCREFPRIKNYSGETEEKPLYMGNIPQNMEDVFLQWWNFDYIMPQKTKILELNGKTNIFISELKSLMLDIVCKLTKTLPLF